MTVVQIRNISDQLYEDLLRQARASEQSVVQYTLDQLRARVMNPNTELFQRLRSKPRPDVSRDDIIGSIREVRGVDP